ncbi:family 20 glycosylhydrolase [Streptomyces sp. A3M-1-3]|uniref:beta-N-acetylhexosaminidase n=1 Tax=Streptomyces sp. A3M-1-3 TaxID=2962044 RepID=UPI0020B86644|nr:glycoside hydrolase family 20 protein [Streptomyces sp. A3M-1-3]MCP3818928.1 family 20 glycosylhydrolase [Streptomyces sp. A3M-1-3]
MWNSRGALTAGGLVAGAAALSAAVVVWPEGVGGGGAKSPAEGKPSATVAAPQAPTPTPTTYPLSTTPRTIPFVRTHEPARGPGWKPAPTARVVVAKGSEALADEAKLLSGELKLRYASGAAARAGDIELALTPKPKDGKAAAPESYTLTTSDRRVRITGSDQAGVFYGTRTLKQSVRADGQMPEGVVRDQPDRPQRGLNVDIARKHFSAGWIEDRLREMADLKLNQLGLHFSDDQGFRIESSSHPEIVSEQHLTKAEVRRILALAARLHITVVPEIDSPGHLGAVLRQHPSLQLKDARGVPTRGAVDISQPGSAKIVDELLREYAQLFPGAYFHLGADEYQALVRDNPEASYPQLAAAARQKYGANARVQDLAAGWLNDRAAVVRPLQKQPKAWNDGFFRGGVVAADKDIEVEYWTGKEIGAREPVEYLEEGRKVVNLNDEYLYYVLGEPNEFSYPDGRRIYEQWTPLVLRGSQPVPERYSDQILGGRLAVWCDLAAAQTPEQVAQGIRLPLRAVAQKLWDPRDPAPEWAQFRVLADKLG